MNRLLIKLSHLNKYVVKKLTMNNLKTVYKSKQNFIIT